MLTFHLTNLNYKRIIKGKKDTEYRQVTCYWIKRLMALRFGDTVRFTRAYTKECVYARYVALEVIRKKDLPDYARRFFYEDGTWFFAIHFKLMGGEKT
jgi:hypothetical protein